MTAEVVDGQDVDATSAAIQRAVDRARDGGGPTFIEAKTYRYVGHSRSDQATYRPVGELDAWLARDPIELFATKLVAAGELSDAEVEAMRRRQRELIDTAEIEALASPPGSIAQMFTHVLAP